ncbi:MAG: hypothetical protein QOI35_1053 [Cryptosporangiaceae bacterium]|nr:hypothetical protein [Cryptosporangiaceae bacterium]
MYPVRIAPAAPTRTDGVTDMHPPPEDGELTPAGALARCAAELAALSGGSGTGSSSDGTELAVAAVEVQRLAALVLRDAVAAGRRAGLSWRDLSALVGVPAATLYRQFHAGGGLGAGGRAPADPGPEPARSEAAPPATPAYTPVPAPPEDLFAGRERELADLPALLTRRRLVMLCGAPGSGKTRLALEFCRSQTRWDHVLWAGPGELGTVAPTLVARADPAAAKVLLVLDGTGPASADAVAALLAEHPKLTVLATGRAPLGIAGEARFRIAPLPPVPTDPADEWLVAAPAARLFADRADAVAPGLALAGHERAIAAICNAAGGLPLGIELAARLCATMPIPEIETALADGIAILAPGGDGLAAAIADSYHQLGPREQRLFRRLSILPGGADHATAVALMPGQDPSSAGLRDLLDALYHHGLLETAEGQPGWFTIPEPLRAFGRAELDRTGETAATHRLLFGWLGERADRIWTENFRSATPGLWEWSPGELANIRYTADAVGRSDQPRYPLLAAISAQFLLQRAELDQAAVLLEKTLAVPGLSTADEARALAVTAQALVLRGRWGPAKDRLTRAYELAGGRPAGPLALQILSSLVCTYSEDEAAEATARSRELIDALRRCGDTELLATASMNAAWFFLVCGQDQDARDAVAEALDLRSGRIRPNDLHTAGVVALTSGQLATATAYFKDGLRESANVYTTLDHIEGLGLAAEHDGDDLRALCLLAGAHTHREKLGLANGRWWDSRLTAAAGTARARVRAAQAASALAAAARMTLPQLADYAVHNRIARPPAPARPLNPRENQVAALVAEGHNNKQIAARLTLSVRTVEAHTTKIRKKLGLTSRAQIAHWVATYSTPSQRSPTSSREVR